MNKGYDLPVGFSGDDVAETYQSSTDGFDEQAGVGRAAPDIAIVEAVYSDRNTCDLTLWTGSKAYNVPLMTKAGLINEEVYGVLDMPSVGDHVIVMFLGGREDRPVILGTIIPYLYPKYQSDQTPVNSGDKAYTDKLLEAGQDDQYKRVFKSGATLQVDDATIIFETPNGFYVYITESTTASSRSFKIEDPHGNVITLDNNGMTLQDKNVSGSYVNKITFSSAGIKLQDVNGNTLELNSAGVQINGTNLEVLR